MAQDTVTVFRDDAGEWRWRRQAANGAIEGGSGEGYRNRVWAEHQARENNGGDFRVVVEGGDE